MFRLSALNEQTKETSVCSHDSHKGTKEAQEAYAFSLYNNALQLQSDQRHDEAIAVYEDLLETSLVTNAATTMVDENGEATERPLKDPGLILKYSTHKNMASMAADSGDIDTAMEHYLQAVMLDPSDVTLWHRIGTHAISLARLALARHAFTCGLQCNENYWPCLDSAITVLYALSDYETCMYWIAKALEKDFGYIKGLVFREKICCECPHLRSDCEALFRDCSLLMHDVEINEAEAEQFINEALELREEHRNICKPQPPKPCPLFPPLSKLSWLSLGESLLSTYELIMNGDDYTLTSPIQFGDIPSLRLLSNDKDDLNEMIVVDIEGSENKKVPDLTKSDEQDKVVESIDEASMTGRSTEDSVDLSEDSIISSEHLARPQQESFVSSQLYLSQELNASDFHQIPDDDVKDVVETLLDVVSKSKDVDTVVMEVVDDLVAMVVDERIDNSDVIRSLLDDIIGKVESEVADSVLRKDSDTYINFPSTYPQANDDSDQEKSKKMQKKKKSCLDSIIEEQMTRRSDRVRTFSKKKKAQDKVVPDPDSPSIDYKQEICNLFPPRLAQEQPNVPESINTCPIPESNGKPFFNLDHRYHCEADDVHDFLQTNDGNYIVDIMQSYYHNLSEKVHVIWEKGVREIVGKIFLKTKSHLILPHLSEVTDYNLIKRILFDYLTCLECLVDTNSKKLEGDHFADIFEYFDFLMSAATSHHKIFLNNHDVSSLDDDNGRHRTWKAFTLRTLWSRSKYHANLCHYDDAICDLETCKEILRTVRTCAFSDQLSIRESPDAYVIELPNMEIHQIISMSITDGRLKNLGHTQIFQSAENLFNQGLYSEVVDILKPTVTKQSSAKASAGSNRAKQLRHLMLSCQHLSDHNAVVKIAGDVIIEIVNTLNRIESVKSNETISGATKRNKDELKQWTNTLNVTLQVTDKVTKSCHDLNNTDVIDRCGLSRALADVISYLLLRIDRGNVLKNLLLSWLLLYKTLASLENEDISKSETPPPSILLLSTAHKWLGEKGQCCLLDGSLLKFFLAEIDKRFRRQKDMLFKEEIAVFTEQCFYCLYSFPSRPKSRRALEHNTKPIALTWKNGLLLFQHFRPAILPEFDSFKTSTVSLELSQLLLKLHPMAPTNISNQIPNSEADLIEFIENDCEDISRLKLSSGTEDLLILSDIYYLLADYYFKNNEMTKAVKYYLLDLRINPVRFDSWAGMALSKSSQIDDRLRLCENKKSQHKVKDSGTERRSMAALACFKQALDFDSNNMKLWIEYGSLAYWTQSMLSRKIKRSGNPLEGAEKKRTEMLKLSRKSFLKVQDCESDEIHDEEWLIQYMLGKIAEKEGRPLKEYIKLYHNAAFMLHRRNAKYPKKIQAKYGYVNDFAIEALEMHFRIHASILKYVLKHPYMSRDEQVFIKDIIEELKHSPFVTRQELKSAQTLAQDTEKASKLVVTSQSDDLTMGSLLPDSILRSLNIDEAKPDEENDTQSSACSIAQPSGELLLDGTDTGDQQTRRVILTQSLISPAPVENPSLSLSNPSTEHADENAEKLRIDEDSIIEACESSFRLCVHRFPHHIKAIYRLAHIYATCPSKQHLSWSRDLLYGATSPWQQLRHMPAPGLLSDRNKTNLFNGVWRIPMDDIDRPGSFPFHLYRCLVLLFDILRRFDQHEALLHIHNLLHRIPEQGKKYLREEDRVSLAGRALAFCRGILGRKICSLNKKFGATSYNTADIETKSLLLKNPSIDRGVFALASAPPQQQNLGNMVDKKEESLNVLMEAYRVYQDTQKHTEATTKLDLDTEPDDKTHQRLLLEAYHKYTCISRSDESSALSPDDSGLLDEALRFCHQQNALRKATYTSSSQKPVTQAVTPSVNHQTNNAKPMVATQKCRDQSSPVEPNIDIKEKNENGMKSSEPKADAIKKSPHCQIKMVEDQGGRTYTKIELPRSFAPSHGSAFNPTAPQDSHRLRLDPGLRHLQDPSKKQLLRSTSVPVSYPVGEENTPPHHRMLCRTGSCVSDSTKLKLKNSILARTSAALVRKPSITDHEMHQLRTGTGQDDSDSSDSEDELEEEEEPHGRKRKYSDDATPSVSSNEHPSLISAHQSAVITTAAST